MTSTSGASSGASILVPADPDPLKPDTLTYTDMYRPAGTAEPHLDGVKILNDPTDRWESAWFDFTAYIGTQAKASIRLIRQARNLTFLPVLQAGQP